MIEPKEWIGIKAGSTLELLDEVSLKASMDAGNGIKPIQLKVDRAAEIQQLDGLCTWYLLYCSGGSQPFLIVAQVVDEKFDIFVFNPIAEVPPGSRKELLDRDCRWMFCPPANPDKFEIGELKFTGVIPHSDQNGEIEYCQTAAKELTGRYIENPHRSGMSHMLGTISQYTTDDPSVMPSRLMLLEIGSEANADGGEITFLSGYQIRENEISVLAL